MGANERQHSDVVLLAELLGGLAIASADWVLRAAVRSKPTFLPVGASTTPSERRVKRPLGRALSSQVAGVGDGYGAVGGNAGAEAGDEAAFLQADHLVIEAGEELRGGGHSADRIRIGGRLVCSQHPCPSDACAHVPGFTRHPTGQDGR